MQNAALGSEFGGVSELGPRWVPPWLAMGGLQGPVETRPFHAKSAFSAKENTFGVGFQLRSPTSQAAVPTEPEAAQTLLGPMGSLELGEN